MAVEQTEVLRLEWNAQLRYLVGRAHVGVDEPEDLIGESGVVNDMLCVRVGPAFLGEKVEEQDKLTENGRSRSVSESVNRITFRSEP